jgi:hypothetical protein
VLIVIASYYALFAGMAGSGHALIVEILAASVFCILAVFGFKGNLWLVTVALIGHGIFDFFRRGLIENPGVPHWWPGSVWLSMWSSARGWLCACCRS